MKRAAIFMVCVVLAACDRPAEQEESAQESPAPAAAAQGVDGEVRATVQRYFDAVASGNHAALDSVLHAGAVRVSEKDIAGHDAFIAHFREGRVKSTGPMNNEVVHVQTFGEDFALATVNGRSQGESQGRKWAGATMIVGVARTAGSPWEVVYFQAVPKAATTTAM